MFDEMFQDGQQALLNDINRRGLPPPPPPPKPGVFAGFGSTVGGSFMQGGAMAARGLGMAASIIPQALESRGPGAIPTAKAMDFMFGEDREPLTDKYFRALDEITKPAVDYWRPDPANAGIASQVVGGFSRMLLPLAAGGGNPSLVVASEQVGAYDELVAQGVDPSTANKAATVRGVTTAIGMALPAALVPGRIAAATAGAVANPVVGIADRAAMQMILENANYDRIAAQYQPLDATAIAIDVLIGGAAGAAGAKPKVAVTPEQHAGALAMNAANVADEATLVSSTDPNARTQAIDVQVEAARAVEQGQPVSAAGRVDVDPVLLEAKRVEAESRLREMGITERELPPGLGSVIKNGSDATLEKMATGAENKIKNRTASDEDFVVLDAIRAEQAARATETVREAPVAKKVEPVEAAAKEEVRTEAPDPIRALIDANPDRIIRTEDGDIRAADLYAKVEAEAAQADIDSRAYEAAATCFLRFGDVDAR